MDPSATAGDDTARPASPPHLEDLLALPRGAWAEVVAHARRALGELDDKVRTPSIRRLQAAPANKLLSGRSRRDLAEVFAAGGPAWVGLHRRLRDSEIDPSLTFLVRGERAEVREAEDAPRAGADDVGARLVKAEAEVSRLKEKARTLRTERDEARRRADGATTRLEAAEASDRAAREELAGARDQIADLQRRLAEADRQRERAVERERRRQDAALAKARDEVTALRRADEDRHRVRLEKDRRAEAEAERARQREIEDRERARTKRAGASDLAAPGRPSEFPPGVAPGTTSYAKALLAPGRRILVDGYNVAKTQRPDLADEAAERQWLEDALAMLVATRHVKVELFWDGDQRDGSHSRRGDLAITFSPRDLTADDDIELAVAASPDDEPLVIVTDDRGLRDRVVPYRIDLLGTQPFGWALRG